MPSAAAAEASTPVKFQQLCDEVEGQSMKGRKRKTSREIKRCGFSEEKANRDGERC